MLVFGLVPVALALIVQSAYSGPQEVTAEQLPQAHNTSVESPKSEDPLVTISSRSATQPEALSTVHASVELTGLPAEVGECDCPDPALRVVEFSVSNFLDDPDSVLATIPANIRWELNTLWPQLMRKLVTEAGATSYTGNYTVRVALAEYNPERLHSLEVIDSLTGTRVDGAGWLEHSSRPDVLIGMEGDTYERLLWQSPVKYVSKSRGVGPTTTTYFQAIPVPKGSTKKPQTTVVRVRAYHLGTDLMAATGTDVHAVSDATVTFAGRLGGFGNLIILDHRMGYQTYYAHLSVIMPGIKAGASVQRGDIIGLVGSTGHSTAPHLHYEVRKDAKYIDLFEESRQDGDSGGSVSYLVPVNLPHDLGSASNKLELISAGDKTTVSGTHLIQSGSTNWFNAVAVGLGLRGTSYNLLSLRNGLLINGWMVSLGASAPGQSAVFTFTSLGPVPVGTVPPFTIRVTSKDGAQQPRTIVIDPFGHTGPKIRDRRGRVDTEAPIPTRRSLIFVLRDPPSGVFMPKIVLAEPQLTVALPLVLISPQLRI